MQITVLIEPAGETGFRASAALPFDARAEGSTRTEALERLQGEIQCRLVNGAQLVSVEVPAPRDVWATVRGMFRDDPLFDAWQEAIQQRRREIDADPES